MNLFDDLRAHLLVLAAVILGAAVTPPVQAQIRAMKGDGWHTWRVPAVASAPEMCCYSWSSGTVTRRGCNLDSRHGGFSTSADGEQPGNELQMYAKLDDGEIAELRALSSSCSVTSREVITDLGPVTTAESLDWLEPLVEPDGDFATEALAAVAVHQGERAGDILLNTANGDDESNREDAVFWMAQVRFQTMGDVVREFVFDDPDPDMREHAAFAYSQSTASDIAEVLIRQGRSDVDGEVRTHAWFWLAQSEAPESEQEILRAIRRDDDEDVREDAVFALSQLPGDRSVKALAQVLEDRSLDLEIREQALFWLAQDGSDEAFEYIDGILTRN